MILVDTSVWVDHLRHRNDRLARLLIESRVLCHPFVIGELSLGHLRDRDTILERLSDLPRAEVAEHSEALAFSTRHGLSGSGLGWVDLHLLSAAALSHAPIWSLDSRLAKVAERLGIKG